MTSFLLLLSFAALARANDACDMRDLGDVAARRHEKLERAPLEKRGIADMPYSRKKLKDAEEKLESLEPRLKAAEDRSVSGELGEQLARFEGACAPRDPYRELLRDERLAPYLEAVKKGMGPAAEPFFRGLAQADAYTREKFLARASDLAKDPKLLKRLGDAATASCAR